MIGIIEDKINEKLIIIDFSLPGYVLCYSETESSHGGTGFFVSNKLSFKQRSDLVINWKLENWNLLLLNSFFQIRDMLSTDVFISTLL